MKRIHILRPGTFESSNGTKFTFSAANLKAMADNYEPSKGEAPLVVGHPEQDHPAFGWVERLEFDAGTNNLYAIPHKVAPDFAAAVDRQAFKKISCALFAPDQDCNPHKGDYYVRHVGFLGAHVPAIPGLEPIAFAAGDAPAVTIEFGSPGGWALAQIVRRLRDWLIADKGLETADTVLPDYAVADIEAAARLPDVTAGGNPLNPSNGFGEVSQFAAPSQEIPMTPAELAEFNKLKTDLAASETKRLELQKTVDGHNATFAANAKAERTKLVSTEMEAAFKDGRLLPVDRPLFSALCASIVASEPTIEFTAADGAKTQVNLLEHWDRFLKGLKPQVAIGTKAPNGAPGAGGSSTFKAPAGFEIDQDRLEIHDKAVTYAKTNNCSYEDAVTAVVNAG